MTAAEEIAMQALRQILNVKEEAWARASEARDPDAEGIEPAMFALYRIGWIALGALNGEDYEVRRSLQ